MCALERSESPLFVKTRDFAVWLLIHTAKFPRKYRHSLTERLECSVLAFQRCLGRVMIMNDPAGLAEADLELWQMKQLMRIAQELHLLPGRGYGYGLEQLAELGRLLGAWRKKAGGT